jgi:hypothetical protein
MTEVSPHYRLRYRLIANGVPEKDADAMATDWLNQRHKCHSVHEHLTMMLNAADRLIKPEAAQTPVNLTQVQSPQGDTARDAALTDRYRPWFGGDARRLACIRLRQHGREVNLAQHFNRVIAESESDARASLSSYMPGAKR